MIIGFGMLRNELENGNLRNWMKCMQDICDYIYIFDQASDDGSLDFYKLYDNVIVIESSTNRFSEEIICKQELLEKILSERSETEWIFWMDGDTLLDQRLCKIRPLLKSVKEKGYDGLRLGHLNLWRSDIYYRVDSLYDYFDRVGRIPFWRNNGKLKFELIRGLHQQQNEMPLGIEKIFDSKKYKLIHRGFVTDDQIVKKYNLYKGYGQQGYDLDRLVDEKILEVREVDKEIIPDWLEIKDSENPIHKEKICKKI